MQKLSIPFDIEPTSAAEFWTAESPARLAIDNARRKVERSPHFGDRSRVLIGADTIIACESRIFGKPAGPESARRMLSHLSGRIHDVITGICLSGPDQNESAAPMLIEQAAISRVCFHQLTVRQISEYVHSGEWQGKAGAYAIQGNAGAFVADLGGDFDNVVGLPIYLIHDLLRTKFVHCRFC